ncbi:MAG: CTP synthase [Synergistaceae bacterium]|nr:CTP synthase [Synergistaceae bacterium]
MTKYIFVTGGVVSSLGKGITAASLGVLLKRRGFNISILKMDPYINVNAGAMSPYQHGEVFVTCDGAETDLDLGHYERFIDESIKGENSCTTGKVYSTVISRERSGGYGGTTVQVIPHITNEIQDRIERVGKNKDIVIAEIGGTVGDIEGLPYLEAIRQLSSRVGRENILYCHVTLVPYIAASGELKTKPTQHSVNELRRIGIQPDIIVCRSQMEVPEDLRQKIALFGSVSEKSVFQALDSDTIYRIPITLHKQNFDTLVLQKLGLSTQNEPNLADWKDFLKKYETREREIVVALVGKYTEVKDAYISLDEALLHAGVHLGTRIKVKNISAETLENTDAVELLGDADAILVPSGFGTRGVEGKIKACKYAREHGIPFLGIGLGMQAMAIEFARNVLNLQDAYFSDTSIVTSTPLIHILHDDNISSEPHQRLGAYKCKLKHGTKAHVIYATDEIVERHRHRYEFNNKYAEMFCTNGMVISGICEEDNTVDIIENVNHPWMIGVEFLPEYLSRPVRPHPLFSSFVREAIKKNNA